MEYTSLKIFIHKTAIFGFYLINLTNYGNPFLGYFETLKEYWRHCHRFMEKSNFFGPFGSQKGAKKANFVQGGFKIPPNGCVNM